MGATNFRTFHPCDTAVVKAASAYADEVQSARYEYGSNPYNGTISTTSGCIVLNRGEPVTAAEVSEWENKLWTKGIDGVDKWGSAGCLKIAKAEKQEGGWLFIGWAAE